MRRYFYLDRSKTRREVCAPERVGVSATSETVATYLNKRLAEIGVKHVYTIPGDYSEQWVETLDDPDQNAGLVRVHPNNEMCAAYAADGYARAIDGAVGCVSFTYGVGAINAAQAVAGSYVERVPVVVLNGSPSQAQYNSERDQGVLYHHMLDGSHTDARIFEELTVMTVRVTNPAIAPDQIDAALRACVTESRPVYIELAAQVAGLSCRAVPDQPLRPIAAPQSQASLDEAVKAILAHMCRARRLVLFGGVEISRGRLQERFAALIEKAQAPWVSSALGKSVLSEFRPDFAGVYVGQSSQDNVQALMRAADCVVALGVQDTDFNYLGVVTPDYDPNADPGLPGPTHIQARGGAVMVGRGLAYWGDVELGALIDALIEAIDGLDGQALPHAPFAGLDGEASEIPPPSSYGCDDAITWDSFKSNLAHQFFASFDEDDHPVLVADSGFSFVALTNVRVPRAGYISQFAWAAIGYGVGAASGVALANARQGRARRTVCVTGDGAFAEALNALGTGAQLGQGSVFFVMDNRVFAVEQWLIQPDAFCPGAPPPEFAPLVAVPQGHIWDYVKLAEGFGGVGYSVSTNAELQAVLAKLDEVPRNGVTGQPTFTLVAVRIPAKDLPSNASWKLTCND